MNLILVIAFLILTTGCNTETKYELAKPGIPEHLPHILKTEGISTNRSSLNTVNIDKKIEVRDEAGRRKLFIDGYLQGSTPLTQTVLEEHEPAVKIMQWYIKPGGKLLVIGLGTGTTVKKLIRLGFKVDVVELYPEVVTIARERFRFTHPVIVSDGMDYVRKTKKRYDGIIVDATLKGKLNPRFRGNKAVIELLTSITYGGALLFNTPGLRKPPFQDATLPDESIDTHALTIPIPFQQQTFWLLLKECSVMDSDMCRLSLPNNTIFDRFGKNISPDHHLAVQLIEPLPDNKIRVGGYLYTCHKFPEHLCIDIPWNSMHRYTFKLDKSIQVQNLRALILNQKLKLNSKIGGTSTPYPLMGMGNHSKGFSTHYTNIIVDLEGQYVRTPKQSWWTRHELSNVKIHHIFTLKKWKDLYLQKLAPLANVIEQLRLPHNHEQACFLLKESAKNIIHEFGPIIGRHLNSTTEILALIDRMGPNSTLSLYGKLNGPKYYDSNFCSVFTYFTEKIHPKGCRFNSIDKMFSIHKSQD